MLLSFIQEAILISLSGLRQKIAAVFPDQSKGWPQEVHLLDHRKYSCQDLISVHVCESFCIEISICISELSWILFITLNKPWNSSLFSNVYIYFFKTGMSRTFIMRNEQNNQLISLQSWVIIIIITIHTDFSLQPCAEIIQMPQMVITHNPSALVLGQMVGFK